MYSDICQGPKTKKHRRTSSYLLYTDNLAEDAEALRETIKHGFEAALRQIGDGTAVPPFSYSTRITPGYSPNTVLIHVEDIFPIPHCGRCLENLGRGTCHCIVDARPLLVKLSTTNVRTDKPIQKDWSSWDQYVS